jgi:hypothetical protein
MEQIEQERLACLPYGQWHTQQGSIVLFDRQYRPIYSQDDKGNIAVMSGNEWIDNIDADKTEYFYNDGNSPDKEFHTLAKVKKVLADWTMKYRHQQVSKLPLPKPQAKQG